jgi:hypothetical protein
MRFRTIFGLAALLLLALPVFVHGQENATVQCGDTVSGNFDVADDEVEFYIDLNGGDVLELSGTSSSAQFVIQFHAPPDWTQRLGESAPLSLNPALTTIPAPAQGTYNVEVDNNKDGVSGGLGAFSLQIRCQQGQSSEQLECGDTILGQFDTPDDEVEYFINLNAGDVLVLSGTAPNAQFVIQFHAPPDWTERLGESAPLSFAPALTTVPAPTQGTYNVEADNNKGGVSGGLGLFGLQVGCIVQNGDVLIVPAERIRCVLCTIAGGTEAGGGNRASVLRLPDTGSLDSTPLSLNSSANGVISRDGSELFIYTVEFTGTGTISLDLTRTSGNLDLGMAVIQGSSILYQVGLLDSDTTQLRLVQLQEGEYTIVVYQVSVLLPTSPEETTFTLSVTL